MNKHPNALAHIRVFPAENTIEVCQASQKINNIKTASKSSLAYAANSLQVEHIWDCISKGLIDMSYACVGYSLDGRPVLDYTAFITLLTGYGFDTADAAVFIDDFAKCAAENSKSPIVMTNYNVSKILTEIKPIEGAASRKSRKRRKKQ